MASFGFSTGPVIVICVYFDHLSAFFRIEGKDKWRKDEKSAEYDWELIKSRLDQLHRARELNDFAALSFLVRTSKPIQQEKYICRYDSKLWRHGK